MTAKNHYSFEANIPANGLKQENHSDVQPLQGKIEVQEVVFLTPAKIKVLVDGVSQIRMASIDIVNRKVYLENGDTSLSEQVFSHIDEVTILPEDFFSAPDDVQEQAEKAEQEREKLYAENVGAKSERTFGN